MSATEDYRFFGFLLRPAGAMATDGQLARQWTEADPWHCATTDPDFWLEQGVSCDSYILFDNEGPVFFWKGVLLPHRTMEMHIQFPPFPKEDRAGRHHLRHRIRAGMIVGLRWLENMLAVSGVEEVYFDTVNPTLAEFATLHLKFVHDGQRLTKRLTGGQTLPERVM